MMFQNNSLKCLNLEIDIPFLIIFQLPSLYWNHSWYLSSWPCTKNGCHLAKMAIWIINKGEFKENITIKSGWNARSIFNPKCIIIQFFQLQDGMKGKTHCLKAFHDIENKRMNLRQHVKRIWREHVRIKSEELNKCTKIDNVPSLSEKSHKSMNEILWFEMTPMAINKVVLSVKTMFWEFLGRFFPMKLNFPILRVHSNPCAIIIEARNQRLHINIFKLHVEFQTIHIYYWPILEGVRLVIINLMSLNNARSCFSENP